MTAFMDFTWKMPTLRCCRNAGFIGFGVRRTLGFAFFLAACLCSFDASAQITADDIARAVRTVRNSEGLSLIRPNIMEGVVTTEEVRGRIDHVLSLLGVRGAGDPDLRARIGEEFIRQDSLEKLFGFKFGVGASVTTARKKGAITEVVVDSNKFVRVTKENNSSVGYLLEAHYFFAPDRPFLNLTPGNWGYGPFVAIQTSTDKALSGLGFGMMLGFRQLGSGVVPVSNLSWNIGIGAIYDPSVKVLGNGIVADRPLPAGESILRTTEVGSWGLMIMTSFNF